MSFITITNSEIASGAPFDNALLVKIKGNFDSLKSFDDNIGEVIGEVGTGSSEASLVIPASDIDWSAATAFSKSLSGNLGFTFSNIVEGKTITVAITNAAAANITIGFPTTKQELDSLETIIIPNSTNIYTFVRINGITYCSSIPGVI